MKCSVPNCLRPHIARSYCSLHYQRWKRSGDPTRAKRQEKHGQKDTKLYDVWCAMKQRCYNPNSQFYYLYGGRGIAVCQEWRDSFLAFTKAMGPRPAGYTLDRIDNDKGYYPENCRWATPAEQVDNRRNTVKFEGMTLRQWAESLGINPVALKSLAYRRGAAQAIHYYKQRNAA